MKIPPVKGTRDFYPPEMAVRNWIIDGWKKVSVRNGFEEYDGPIFEYLKMFQIKSGDEIVEQLFSLQDRGGRDLALRPEITPTLARMVNQRINSLPKPIKWFSVPRLFRAERPQKGRLREFFQWNIDIIGVESVLADAEVILTTLDFLREVGLTSRDIQVKISSRKLLSLFLTRLGIPAGRLEAIYSVLDKKNKLPSETFEQMLEEQVQDKKTLNKIIDFMTVDSMPQLEELVKAEDDEFAVYNEIIQVLACLGIMGVDDFCKYEPSIVRGLAYYTGIVFEVHAVGSELRAICGGGRYDNLLRDFDGPSETATGMGMGDCVLEILLREKGLLDKNIAKKQIDYFVFCVDRIASYKAVELVMKLRQKDIRADFSYAGLPTLLEQPSDQDGAVALAAELRRLGWKSNFTYNLASLSKQLKQASAQKARKFIIIGEEFLENNQLIVKDMATGEQELVNIAEFMSRLKA
jgi:histidyl-tRNA synthetase